MDCQKNIAKKIVKKGGHYCLDVKGNNENLYLDIKEYFNYELNTLLERISSVIRLLTKITAELN